MKRVLLQPAFVLHSRVYRDTSLLVDVLTEQYGRLSLIARGVRKNKSRLSGVLVPFLPLFISFGGKTDLYSLQKVETDGPSYDLRGDLLLSGFYLNELLVKLLPRHESYADVYLAYKKALSSLVESRLPEVELRLFEKCLLKSLGYGLELDKTVCGAKVLADKQYVFEFGVGVKQAESEKSSNFCGKSLFALQQGVLQDPQEISDAKRLLRSVLANLLGQKTLKSRELFYPKNGSCERI